MNGHAFRSERHFALSNTFPPDDVEARYRRQRTEANPQEWLDTTRRHPRTLAEAFPDERAAALHVPRPRAPVFTKPMFVVALALVATWILVVAR